jgi:hypothetical protein
MAQWPRVPGLDFSSPDVSNCLEIASDTIFSDLPQETAKQVAGQLYSRCAHRVRLWNPVISIHEDLQGDREIESKFSGVKK